MLAVPAILYGSESWVLNKQTVSRIVATEMKCLRFVAGYTRMDMKYNEDIRNKLQIFSLIDKIAEYRRKWYDHVCRMSSERAPFKILNYTPRGRRDQGRPLKRWIQQL